MNNEYTCGLQVLDADNGRQLESSTGRVATRDMVQFVPMREVQSKYQLLFKLTCLSFNSLALSGPSNFCTHFISFHLKLNAPSCVFDRWADIRCASSFGRTT